VQVLNERCGTDNYVDMSAIVASGEAHSFLKDFNCCASFLGDQIISVLHDHTQTPVNYYRGKVFSAILVRKGCIVSGAHSV